MTAPIRVGLFPVSESLSERAFATIETLPGWEVHRWTEWELVGANAVPCDLIALALDCIANRFLECLQRVSQGAPAPIIVTVDVYDPQAVAATLRAGADDFIAQPFAAEELVARMENLVLRARRFRSLHMDPIHLDRASRTIVAGDARAHLSPREWSIFLVLFRHVGEPVSIELLKQTDELANLSESSIVTSISRLRQRLAAAEIPDLFIETVPRRGYMLSRVHVASATQYERA